MPDTQIIEKKYFLREKIDETPEVLTVRFAPEDGLPVSFDPGMFEMISGVDKDGKRYIGRAFSIASDPGSVEMEFFIVKQPLHPKVVATPKPTTPGAPAAPAQPPVMVPEDSHFVKAAIGDPFMLKGPSGQFKFDPNKDKKVLFIAGGTGLAPFMSMLRHIKVLGADVDVGLLYSVKFPTEIIRKQELEGLESQIKLRMTVSVTRPAPGDGWLGQTGHINAEIIQKYTPDVKERMCYICGPLAFVKAIKDALTQLGLPADRVSADVWG